MGFCLNAHINCVQQLDLHWIGAGRHLICKVAIAVNLKRVAKAAEAGLGENVVRLVEIVVTGDADGFGKLAEEVNLNFPSSDYNLTGQLKGVDLILKSEKVTFILYLR